MVYALICCCGAGAEAQCHNCVHFDTAALGRSITAARCSQLTVGHQPRTQHSDWGVMLVCCPHALHFHECREGLSLGLSLQLGFYSMHKKESSWLITLKVVYNVIYGQQGQCSGCICWILQANAFIQVCGLLAVLLYLPI